MKYIYIAGLEHSGTTLVNHIIAQHPLAVGLGEVSSYFSKEHMHQYISKWGDYSDVRLCSCGKDWDDCDFWGEIRELNGLYSDYAVKDKYTRLISYIRSKYGDDVVVVDSSKTTNTLRTLLENRGEYGFGEKDFLVVMMLKDVRNFTASIYRKSRSRASILNYLKTFNWWLSVNRNLLDFLQKQAVPFQPILYEHLCNDPEKELERIFGSIGLISPNEITMNHNHSHIAMGNKNFIMRNGQQIRYDNRWFLEDGILGAYLLHTSARRFNKDLYQLTQESVS